MAMRIRITIETGSLLVLQFRTAGRGWCPDCGTEVPVIALAALDSRPELSLLRQWLDSGDLHRSQAAGSTLICLNSLLARARTTKTHKEIK